ncbi:MAG: OmpA family protein [Cytophagales bacterium]|nr:OmpA family protein [Cytophagales bacterium]
MKKLITYTYFLLIALYLQSQDTSKVVKVKRLPFNTRAAEHSPIYYKGGLLFVSNRQSNLSVVYTSEEDDTPLTDLYYAAKISDKWKKPVLMPRPINSGMSEGPASITKDTSRIYFTRNDVEGSDTKLNIYYCNMTKNGWSNAILHPVNHEKFSCGHPAIASSGSFMIFSSNMPGGMGGTDLYITYYKENKWTKPKNLGKNINTPKNEITPFILENNILYFASNGRSEGIGGYDIYSATYEQFEWRNVKNLGTPYNSPSHDFGYITTSELVNGYFSSNRVNGGDDDDIFYFEKTNEIQTPCDSLKNWSLCRTFFEEGTINTGDEASPLVYQWDLGDGHKKKGNEVRYCYSTPGIYKVQLNVVDLISDQVYLNEATYEIEIKSISGPYFSLPDTLLAGKEYTLDASPSVIPDYVEKSYVWDIGEGKTYNGQKVNYKFNNTGKYTLKLTINGVDNSLQKFKLCVTKDVVVLKKNIYDKSKVSQGPPQISMMASAKKVYSIKDSEGNEYKIQLATSQKSIKHEFKKLEGVIKVDEYYDRDVFGYTTGSFKKPADAYPTMKKIKKIGFTEAVLIATKNGKVISGDDSTFFVPMPLNLKPIRIISLKGKIITKNGEKLPATLRWESLTTGDTLGSFVCNRPVGDFVINFADGDLYGYSASMTGYFPASNYLDLRKENDYSEISTTIIMYEPQELVKDSTAMKLTNIFFSPDKYEITSESMPELERLAEFINNTPEYYYEISGHTDHTGTAEYNKTLSEQRANAVKKYLLKLGCDESRLQAVGYGNTRPATTNRQLLELNRRVEFKLYKKN